MSITFYYHYWDDYRSGKHLSILNQTEFDEDDENGDDYYESAFDIPKT
jgi:hypothetical protein